jgi:hypothetical protein
MINLDVDERTLFKYILEKYIYVCVRVRAHGCANYVGSVGRLCDGCIEFSGAVRSESYLYSG